MEPKQKIILTGDRPTGKLHSSNGFAGGTKQA